MKKSLSLILSSVFLGVLFVAVSVWAAPIQMSNGLNSDNFERVVKVPQKYSLRSTTEESIIGIHNCIVSPVIDNNLNKFYVAIYYFTTVDVPDEGITFYIHYYYRIWEGNEWGEWVKVFEGVNWFFSKDDSWSYYLELYIYFLEEKRSIPPSKAQFMVEMYDSNSGNLLDTFVPIRGPRLESEFNDNKGYLPDE